MKAPPTSYNKRKYCWFHYNYDHNTEKCIQLNDKIEALIQKGYLGKYIYGGGAQSHAQTPNQQQVEREISNQSKARVVNMISRGVWSRRQDIKKTFQEVEDR